MKPYASYNPPSKYTTPNDSPEAQELERRWRACSDEARSFAAYNCGHFFGILPHVVAEHFDRSQIEKLMESRNAKSP